MRYLTVSLITVLSTLVSASTTSASAPSLSVRIEQPQSPTRLNEWKLSYAVLDRLARTPSVTCYVKKPGSGSFVQFDTSKISTKPTGDNGSCQVNSSIISSGQGIYEFYVTASATTPDESRSSATASVLYDTEGPDRPVSYTKEHPWACRYTIKFKTADDGGKTAWVEIFGSKSTSFSTDNGTRIGSVGIGSNQEGSLNHDLAGDDCNQVWYYVIRAFDSVGNQSTHLGDEVVTVTSGTPTPPTSALVVTTAGRGGSVLGSDQAADDEGEVLGEAGDGEEQAESVEGDGLVGGATRTVQSLAKNKSFWWIVLIIIGLRIVYGILRKPNNY